MTATQGPQQLIKDLARSLWRSHSATNIDILQPMLVRAVLFFVSVAAGLNLVALAFVPRSEIPMRIGISAAIFGSVVLVRFVQRRWNTRVASHLLITALWLTASYPVALRGVHSAAYSAYLLLIVIGITLVGNRGGVLVTLGSLAVGAAAVYMERMGWLDTTPLDPVMIWSAHAIFSVVMIAVTGLAYSLVNSALKQTSERGAQLADSNRRLSEGTTALNQANRAFQLISACNQAITHATSTEDILHTACPNLVDIGGYGFALFAVRSDHAIQRLQTVAHAGDPHFALGGEDTRGLFAVDSVLTSYADWALRSGQPITFPYRAQETSQATSTQTDNSAADTYCGLFPLIKGDTPAGVMLVFSAAEENFTADEVTLLSNVAKDIAYGIVAFQSIARQKEEAARVQMTNELLTATLASIDHAVFVLEGPDRIVRMCNAKAERIFGYTADELIGHSISMVHRDRESYEAFISDRMAHLSNKQTFRTEFTAYHRDGSPRILDVTITPLRQSMSLASAEVSVVRDITEDHIKSEQLKASETNYRELFNSMREGFVLLKMIGDDDGRNVDYVIVEANPAFEEITGLPREQIVGQQVRHRFPAIDEATLASYVKVVETGEPMRSEEYIADIDKHLDITAFCPRQGHLVATIQDITERYTAQRALEEERAHLAQRVAERTAELTAANAELAQTARHKDEFLAGMSHELRTPLNTILGAAELLLEEVYGPLSRMQRTRLRNIEESGQHLLELINEVLDMAKIEAGKLQLETEPVDVENTCEASLRLIQQAAHKKGLRVDVEIADDVGVIEADGRRLKQMLVNLLSNAVKFTPSEGVIGLRAARDLGQGVVRFTVWDTGIGIAKDEQKRLFMPFVQVDSALTRQYDGTGLGLSLVHKMAQLHGGELSLESALGYGSEFTVTLPLSDESVEQATENSQTMPLEAPVLSVLLIGENQVDAQALNAYFADKAYTVHLAQNHEAAIRHVQETYYHLIIIDLHVTATHSIDVRKGNSDALKTVQAIRAESRCRFSPIVLLAEQQACPDQQESQRAGVTACLQKAPDMQQLFAALEELLHREILS